MDVDFDSGKDATNLAKHGVSLAEAERFDMDTAWVRFDDRHGEDRWVAIGYIDMRVHVLAFTERGGRIRPISLCRAGPIEVRRYEQST